MKLKLPNGDIREVEGIDINVYNLAAYGDPETGVEIYGYAMSKDKNGFWDTDTGTTLFAVETNLEPEEWGDDWFGFSDEMTPGDIPGDVLNIVNNVLKEIQIEA